MAGRTYAEAGVDYRKIEPFKRAMIEVARGTVQLPNRRGVVVDASVLHSHGGVYGYEGGKPHLWCKTIEGLGNKNWIAEWMYRFGGTGRTYYDAIGFDTAMMAVNDCIAQGALPVIFEDLIDAGDSEWFHDARRAGDLATGFRQACEAAGMALVAGESAALRYLVKATPPVDSAPALACAVTGIVAPRDRLVTGARLAVGDRIVGIASSGLHANGASLAIRIGLGLPDAFLAKLPSGRTLGEALLDPTVCYVGLVEALLDAEVDIHALLPGTGSGVAKLAFDDRPCSYRVHSWPEVPEVFRFLAETGLSPEDCVTTFNWGVGYFVFVPAGDAERTVDLARAAGYTALELGRVEEGER
jgi:phosphoribosylformylglycinamidine cyclo-ligase